MPLAVRTKLSRWRQNSLLRNAGWMFAGQAASVVMQAGYFILLARLLGPQQYGVFAGAFAFVMIFAPYASMGSGPLFMRYVGLDPSNKAAFLGNILLSSAFVGTFFVFALHTAAPYLLNAESASLVLMLSLANCVFAQLVSNLSQVFQTFERLKMTALLNLLVNLFRFLAIVGLFVFLHRSTALQWTLATTLTSGLSAALCLFLIFREFGKPSFQFGLLRRKATEGLTFTLGWSAQSVYNDFDKTLLSHYGMNLANGLYTTAYRAIDVATTPVTALDAAAIPRYYRDGRDTDGVMRMATRLARKASLAGLGLSVVMLAGAPLLPVLLGRSYAPSVAAIRWLSLIPALRGWHQLTGSAIGGMGFQRYRTTAQFVAAALNLGLNLWLIPRFGWLGAAWASLASDGSLCLLNIAIFRFIKSHHLKGEPSEIEMASEEARLQDS